MVYVNIKSHTVQREFPSGIRHLQKGPKPVSEKVKAVKQILAPTRLTNFKFLGPVNYRFIPNSFHVERTKLLTILV